MFVKAQTSNRNLWDFQLSIYCGSYKADIPSDDRETGSEALTKGYRSTLWEGTLLINEYQKNLMN